MPFEIEPGVMIPMVPKGTNIDQMLQNGETAAIFQSHPLRQVLDDTSEIRGLFADSKAGEARRFD